MRLVDDIVKESPLLGEARRYNMRRKIVEIPRMTLGTRVLHADDETGRTTEEVVPHFESIQLHASRHVVDHTIRKNAMDSANAKVIQNKYLVDQFTTDLELAAIYTMRDVAENKVTAYQQLDEITTAFSNMIRALPTKYRSMRELRLYVAPDVYYTYKSALMTRSGGLSMRGHMGELTYCGIPLRLMYSMDKGTMILTNPSNLVWGVHGEPTTRVVDRNDAETTYVGLDSDFLVQNPEALVFGSLIALEGWAKFKVVARRKLQALVRKIKAWFEG